MICWLDDIEPRINCSEQQIQDIINATTTFSDQIDSLAKARGWFRPGLPSWLTIPVLGAYLSGVLTVDEAVDKLATPIEQAWAKQLEQPSSEPDGDDRDADSGLIDLWFGVLHAAKKSPWDDEVDSSQQKLLYLLEVFKNRPDPDFTVEQFPRLAEDWLYDWNEGKLWSNLSLFGLAVAESRNDAPSHDSGCTGPEIQAYFNVNALMARMTVTGVRDAWHVAMCFMAASTEGGSTRWDALDQDGVRIDFQIILMWLKIAGIEWWDKCCRGPQVPDVRLDVNVQSKRCPWVRNPGYNTKVFAKARWRWWKGRFGLVAASKGDRWSEGSKQLARKIIALMRDIESVE